MIRHGPRGALAGVVAVAWLLAASMTAGCGGDEAASRETAAQPEIAVRVTRPVARELPRFVRVTGTLFGEEETTIAAKVSGRVVEVVRDLGDTAAPGDALIRIDPIDYELAKSERERAFVEALARLGLEALPTEEFDVDALPSVERARLQAENAKARFERARVLATRKPPLISEQDFADIETTWEVAQSNLKVERLTAEATLAEARTLDAQVRIADQRVSDTVLRAPLDQAGAAVAAASGVDAPNTAGDDASDERAALAAAARANGGRLYEVAERMVTVGDYVQIGAPLIRLVDGDPLKLRVPVPERRLGTVKREQAVSVRVEAFDRAFAGRVSRVSPAVDTRTRAFTVEVLVDNPDLALKPGSFGTAEIEVGRESALTIPESSVVTFAGVHKVVRVRDGKAEERRVELGERRDGYVEIRKGVEPDDAIVTEPSGALTNGTPVTVVASAESAAPPGQKAQP